MTCQDALYERFLDEQPGLRRTKSSSALAPAPEGRTEPVPLSSYSDTGEKDTAISTLDPPFEGPRAGETTEDAPSDGESEKQSQDSLPYYNPA